MGISRIVHGGKTSGQIRGKAENLPGTTPQNLLQQGSVSRRNERAIASIRNFEQKLSSPYRRKSNGAVEAKQPTRIERRYGLRSSDLPNTLADKLPFAGIQNNGKNFHTSNAILLGIR